MLWTRRVLPMPASPSITSADARPPLSWRTAAPATASPAPPPPSPPAHDTPKTPPPHTTPPRQRQNPAQGQPEETSQGQPREGRRQPATAPGAASEPTAAGSTRTGRDPA